MAYLAFGCLSRPLCLAQAADFVEQDQEEQHTGQ